MPANSPDAAQLPPPHVQLVQMGTAHWISHMLYATAKLGIADHLATGAKTADQLAGPTQMHAPSLYRLMRTLASLGILSEDASHAFTLTPLGQALRKDAPGAARSTILLMASDWWFRGWNEL